MNFSLMIRCDALFLTVDSMHNVVVKKDKQNHEQLHKEGHSL